jgi:DNA-binding transcriptional ArsR family regulator
MKTSKTSPVAFAPVHSSKNLTRSDAFQAELVFMVGVLGPCTVAQLVEATGEKASRVSYHLKKLGKRQILDLTKVANKIVASKPQAVETTLKAAA